MVNKSFFCWKLPVFRDSCQPSPSPSRYIAPPVCALSLLRRGSGISLSRLQRYGFCKPAPNFNTIHFTYNFINTLVVNALQRPKTQAPFAGGCLPYPFPSFRLFAFPPFHFSTLPPFPLFPIFNMPPFALRETAYHNMKSHLSARERWLFVKS